MNFVIDAQAIGVGILVFEIHPFDIFIKNKRMSQTNKNSKVMAVINQVADTVGKRRETSLALNFESDAQAIGVALVSFWIHPFDNFVKCLIMYQTDPKCKSYNRFQPVG